MPAILAEGLRAQSYWANSGELADYYDSVVRDEGKEPVTLTIRLSELDAAAIHPDKPSLAEPITTAIGMSSEDVAARWWCCSGTWQDSLAIVGSIRYDQIIAAPLLHVAVGTERHPLAAYLRVPGTLTDVQVMANAFLATLAAGKVLNPQELDYLWGATVIDIVSRHDPENPGRVNGSSDDEGTLARGLKDIRNASEDDRTAYGVSELQAWPFDDAAAAARRNQKTPDESLIFSRSEADVTANRYGFWSSEHGWGDFGKATRFTATEREGFTLPASTGSDAIWVDTENLGPFFRQQEQWAKLVAAERVVCEGSGVKNPMEAKQFFEELLAEMESLEAIVEQYGSRTLSGLMYLQNAILKGTFIDHYNGESHVAALVSRLPSATRWQKFIIVQEPELQQTVTNNVA